MDNFNYKRFNREFSPEFRFSAVSFLIKGIEKGKVTFAEFWQSSERKDLNANDFLKQYFKCREQSYDIIRYFYDNCQSDLVDAIKQYRAFDKPQHFELIKQALGSECPLIKELEFWSACFAASQENLERANKSFLVYVDFEQLLHYCGFYYDKIRLVKRIRQSTDMNLIQVVSAILNYKLEKVRKEGHHFVSRYTEEAFLREGGKILEQLVLGGDHYIDQVFSVFDQHLQLCDLYDKYRFQGFKVKFQEDNIVSIEPAEKSKYLKYRNDGAKYIYWQNYHQNNLLAQEPELVQEINEAEISPLNKAGNINSHVNYLQYTEAGYPEEITLPDETTVNALSCFRILNAVGSWTNSRWNTFIEQVIISKDEVEPYGAIMAARELNSLNRNSILPICNRVYDEWIKVNAGILQIDEKACRACFKLLTNNLGDTNHPLDLMETPFIKYGQNVYWIAGIFSNKNYCVALQNILSRREEIREIVAKKAEQQLEEVFRENEFVTLINHNYYDRNGEIDLLAIKGNVLFVCQVKSTYNRLTLQDVAEHRNDKERGIRKAISQLEKDVHYLRVYWERISADMNIAVPFEEITFVPLAVTTSLESYEGRLQIAGQDAFIVPLFDLKLILQNEKGLLWNIPLMALEAEYGNEIPGKFMEALAGGSNDEATQQELGAIIDRYLDLNEDKIKKSLLREKPGPCSAEDLLTALRENKLWDFLPGNEELHEHVLKVGTTLIRFKE